MMKQRWLKHRSFHYGNLINLILFAAIIYSIMKGSNRTSSTLKDFRILFSPRSIIFFKKNALNLKIYL